MGYQSPMRYRLVIGNKNISSWSLRPWLAMRQAGIPFEEIKIALRRPDTLANIVPYSPSGRVPALLVGDFAIWDSWPSLNIWPRPTQKPDCGRPHSLPARSPARSQQRCTRALPRSRRHARRRKPPAWKLWTGRAAAAREHEAEAEEKSTARLRPLAAAPQVARQVPSDDA